jgi:lysophospholipase L1-like esterase
MRLQEFLTTKGKPGLIFGGYRFRKVNSSADRLSWRCLLKGCPATMKTDLLKTKVLESSGHHSHSPQQLMEASSPASTVGSTCVEGGRETGAGVQDDSSVRVAVDHLYPDNQCLDNSKENEVGATMDLELFPDDESCRLRRENEDLKRRLEVLREERSVATVDRSMDQDTPLSRPPLSRRMSFSPFSFNLKNYSLSQNVINKRNSNLLTDGNIVEENKKLKLALQNLTQEYDDAKLFIQQLKTTIEVIENDNLALRNEISSLEKPNKRDSRKDRKNVHLDDRSKNTNQNNNLKTGQVVEKHVTNFSPEPSAKDKNISHNIYNNNANTKIPTFKLDTQKIGKNSKKKIKNKFLILGDSNGRKLNQIIEDSLHDRYEISAILKPGARLGDVTTDVWNLTKDFGKQDYVLVIGGTNDVNPDNDYETSIKKSLKYLLPLSLKTNLLISQIPEHYLYTHRKNLKIANEIIYSCISEFRKIEGLNNLLEIQFNNSLRRSDFTTHGLHLNLKGKRKILDAILLNLIEGSPQLSKEKCGCLSSLPASLISDVVDAGSAASSIVDLGVLYGQSTSSEYSLDNRNSNMGLDECEVRNKTDANTYLNRST